MTYVGLDKEDSLVSLFWFCIFVCKYRVGHNSLEKAMLLYFGLLLIGSYCTRSITTGFQLRPVNRIFPTERTGQYQKISFTLKMADSRGTLSVVNNESDGILFRVIQINDVYKLDNFPHFKSLVDHYKTEKSASGLVPSKTIVVLAGDFLGPSLLSSLDRGRGFVDIMTACGVSHVCFGNHETDIPIEKLPDRVEESGFVWVNTNMRDIDDKLGVKTKPYDILTVTKENCKGNKKSLKKVAVLGLLTDDPALYREGAFGNATIEPIMECTKRTLEELGRDQSIDYILPLTHQSMPFDREFAKHFGDSFPLVIGGHDHDIYDEVHNSCRIVKTGMDAINTAVIDIEWSSNNGESSDESPTIPSIHVDMIPTKNFPADPAIQKRCNSHMRIVRELDVAQLFRINSNSNTDKFTTENNRRRPTNGSVVLTTAIRRGMRAECAILNAGSIRGGKTYDTEWFTWSDLKSEIPFPTEVTTVKIPGRVISDTIAFSRRGAYLHPPVENGGYMQTCDMICYNNDKQCIDKIRGEEFDPDREYLTALPIGALKGMDYNEPLLKWASEHQMMIHEESGIPGKMLIVEFFAASLWLDLGSFADIDSDKDGVITPEELKNHAENVFGREFADLVIANVMAVADLDDDGCIHPLEMLLTRYIATDMMEHVSTPDEVEVVTRLASELLDLPPHHSKVKVIVEKMFERVDTKKNGRMTRDEAIAVLGDLHSSEILS